MDEMSDIRNAIGVLLAEDNMTMVEFQHEERGLIMLTFEPIQTHTQRIDVVCDMIRTAGIYSKWPIRVFHPGGMLVIAADGSAWTADAD